MIREEGAMKMTETRKEARIRKRRKTAVTKKKEIK